MTDGSPARLARCERELGGTRRKSARPVLTAALATTDWHTREMHLLKTRDLSA